MKSNAPRLETQRVTLRPFGPADLDDLAALNSDPEVMRYISPPLDREQAAKVLGWVQKEWVRAGYGWFALHEKCHRRLHRPMRPATARRQGRRQ